MIAKNDRYERFAFVATGISYRSSNLHILPRCGLKTGPNKHYIGIRRLKRTLNFCPPLRPRNHLLARGPYRLPPFLKGSAKGPSDLSV